MYFMFILIIIACYVFYLYPDFVHIANSGILIYRNGHTNGHTNGQTRKPIMTITHNGQTTEFYEDGSSRVIVDDHTRIFTAPVGDTNAVEPGVQPNAGIGNQTNGGGNQTNGSGN